MLQFTFLLILLKPKKNKCVSAPWEKEMHQNQQHKKDFISAADLSSVFDMLIKVIHYIILNLHDSRCFEAFLTGSMNFHCVTSHELPSRTPDFKSLIL